MKRERRKPTDREGSLEALRSLSVTFEGDATTVRVSYTTGVGKAPNPGTKARQRQVQELARRGLAEALEALTSEAGEVAVVGEAGFTHRQDTLCCSAAEGEEG